MSNENLVIVDGFKIRNHVDSDFDIINLGSGRLCYYKRRHFIPPTEVWLDYPYVPELEFMLTVLAVGEQAPFPDYSQERAYLKQRFAPHSEEKVDPSAWVERSEIVDGMVVNYVAGAMVRKLLDPHFCFGGHHLVYPYIPANTIWIDTSVVPEEQKFVFLHEKVEYDLMLQGKHYDIAHRFAVVHEEEMRKQHGAAYPGEDEYPWRHWTNENIIERFILYRMELPEGWDQVKI